MQLIFLYTNRYHISRNWSLTLLVKFNFLVARCRSWLVIEATERLACTAVESTTTAAVESATASAAAASTTASASSASSKAASSTAVLSVSWYDLWVALGRIAALALCSEREIVVAALRADPIAGLISESIRLGRAVVVTSASAWLAVLCSAASLALGPECKVVHVTLWAVPVAIASLTFAAATTASKRVSVIFPLEFRFASKSTLIVILIAF
jgi:hypothetical protein